MPFRWSTQDYTTLTRSLYGENQVRLPNIFVATGFRKWGMTNGTASALLIRDLIVKGESPWAPVYDPARFEADPMVKKFISINADVAKHLIGDKLKPVTGDLDLRPGEAKVMEWEGERVGVYKDEQGKIHAVDNTCTHMGANWSGMPPSGRGIVPVTVPGLPTMETSLRAPP